MNTRVRLFPLLAAVAVGAFAVKAVSIAEAAGNAAKAQKKEETHDAAAEPATPVSDTSNVPSPVTDETEQSSNETCVATEFLSDQTGLSQYEIQVLRNLADRRDELEDREADLDTRELTISAAELRLNDQIDELKELETSIQGLLDQLDQKNDEQLASLVKVYESMKPKDAARIFDTLDDELMLSLADRMKPAAMAAVLSYMSPDRARTLTQLMAQKTEPPQTLDDLEARSGGG